MKTEKPTNIVIKEMERERDTFIRKTTPYRRINRAVKKLQKLEKIENIISDWKENPEWDMEMHDTLEEIIKVLEQE